MQITFLAVQCFQCETMQVKQQKKSSNKWNCVVCGEKQSIRKVFAQGSMAKDIRGFVQSFNMSRQFKEEKFPESTQVYDEEKKRRTDWTEYIEDDYEEECSRNLDVSGGDVESEPIIVTEMPKSKGIASRFSNANERPPNRVKKGVSKRARTCDENVKFREKDDVDEQMESNQADRALKWNVLRAKIQQGNRNSLVNMSQLAAGSSFKRDSGDENELPQRRLHQATFTKGIPSKWSSFITDDDFDELQVGGRGNSYDRAAHIKSDAMGQSATIDEKVEDDIHPDFL